MLQRHPFTTLQLATPFPWPWWVLRGVIGTKFDSPWWNKMLFFRTDLSNHQLLHVQSQLLSLKEVSAECIVISSIFSPWSLKKGNFLSLQYSFHILTKWLTIVSVAKRQNKNKNKNEPQNKTKNKNFVSQMRPGFSSNAHCLFSVEPLRFISFLFFPWLAHHVSGFKIRTGLA